MSVLILEFASEELLRITQKDRNQNFFDEQALSLLCSELEGSLKIEGVNTTRRQIMKVIKNEKHENKNDQIIKNMYDGFRYVLDKPEFNKDNLKHLYDLLSKNCLDDDDLIGDRYYRYDDVVVGNKEYVGCPAEKIEEAMNSLFVYVKDIINREHTDREFKLLPHICHYYFLYIHPYFDFNGRTARMVYLWIRVLGNHLLEPLYLSEAINDEKVLYYKAIEESRDSCNDLTYFLIFCLSLANAYQIIYKNCNTIANVFEEKAEQLSVNDLYNIKRIMINKQTNYFTSKTYENWTNREISRQATFKELSRLESLKILLSKTDGKTKFYKLNDELITYQVPKVKEY